MNHSNAEGVFDQAKGKVKQALGETFHDEKLADSGAADQLKGHAEETWGNVKDTAHDLGRRESTDASVEAHHTGDTLRDKVTSGAESVKNSINRGLDHLKGE